MVLGSARLLVFDLDGTLIDSQVDLANSVNAMLLHYGRPPLPLPIVAGYIGDGASVLVRRALAHTDLAKEVVKPPAPLEEAFLGEALERFISFYRDHMLDHTFLYPGVFKALACMRDVDPYLPMAVLTNKPVGPSRAICSHFGLDRFFFQVYGGNSFSSKKPDAKGLLTLIAEASDLTGTAILPQHTVMIGDSHVDVQTARACGAVSLGCTFGLSPVSLRAAGPDLLVDHAAEWPVVLNLLGPRPDESEE